MGDNVPHELKFERIHEKDYKDHDEGINSK